MADKHRTRTGIDREFVTRCDKCLSRTRGVGGGVGEYWPNDTINPLNSELNPICHFLALLRAHHILHVSSVRVKSEPFML